MLRKPYCGHSGDHRHQAVARHYHCKKRLKCDAQLEYQAHFMSKFWGTWRRHQYEHITLSLPTCYIRHEFIQKNQIVVDTSIIIAYLIGFFIEGIVLSQIEMDNYDHPTHWKSPIDARIKHLSGVESDS